MKTKIKQSYKMPVDHKIYLVLLVIAAILIIAALVKGPPKFEIPMESFTIVYTNNVEANLRQPDAVEAVDSVIPADFTTLFMNIAQLKAEAGNRNEPVIFLDCGNTLAGDEDTFSFPSRNPIDRLLYEVPYSGILFRENEYLTGRDYLKTLSKKFAYLGMNTRNDQHKQAFITNSFKLLNEGNLKIAVLGYFIPPGSPEEIRNRFPDFNFEKDADFIKVVLGSIDADAKILLISSPDFMETIKHIDGVDLVISGSYNPLLDFQNAEKIDNTTLAPYVDSRFDVGKVRFTRQKSKGDSKKKNPWEITSTVKMVETTDEVPPGGILNIVLDANQNLDVKYRGKYRLIYDTLAFWSPENTTTDDVLAIMGESFSQYFNIGTVIIDSDKIKMPKTQAWGTTDILEIPGKTLHLTIIRADEELLKNLKEKNGKKLYFFSSSPSEKIKKESQPRESFILIDRDIIQNFTLKDLKGLREVPFPSNFILLDYIRKNRGKIYNKLTNEKSPFRASMELIDRRKFYMAAKSLEEYTKTHKIVDALIYLGLAKFKNGDYQQVMDIWKQAQKLAPSKPGIKKILEASPRTGGVIQKKKEGATWSKFRGNSQNTGRTDTIGPSTNLLKWKFEALDKISSSPAVAPDGTIYVGAEDFFLYALKPTGELKWKFRTGLPIRSSPCIDVKGNVYVGSDDKNLYAFSPSGKKLWSFEAGGYFSSSPVVDKDGTVYAGCEDFNIYAIEPNGKLKWKFVTNGVVFSSPALTKDGTIYIGSEDHYLYAIDSPHGKLKWKFETQHKVNASPTVGDDGTVYVGSEDRSFYAIKPDGSLKWKRELENYLVSSPAIAKDGTIYTGGESKALYALDSSGKVKWQFTTKGEVISSPLVDGKGNIYVGCDDGNLYAITPDGKKMWEFNARDPIMSSPAIGADGTLYFGSEDRNVYAVGE